MGVYEEAMNLYSLGYDEEALPLILEAADDGNAKAQYMCGDIYYHGVGVEKNLEEALMWYEKAAEQGHDGARIALRSCFDCAALNES